VPPCESNVWSCGGGKVCELLEPPSSPPPPPPGPLDELDEDELDEDEPSSSLPGSFDSLDDDALDDEREPSGDDDADSDDSDASDDPESSDATDRSSAARTDDGDNVLRVRPVTESEIALTLCRPSSSASTVARAQPPRSKPVRRTSPGCRTQPWVTLKRTLIEA
jgi:hypothetical protein